MSHMTIGVIVSGKDAEDATGRAEGIMEELLNRTSAYENYSLDEEDLPKPVKVLSKEGKKAVKKLWGQYMADLKAALYDIRGEMDLNDDDATLNHKDNFRYACYRIGTFEGGPITLYDCGGAGVREKRDLTAALCKRGDGNDVWLVSVDVRT